MTGGALLAIDLLVAAVAAATWIGAGATAAARRTAIALALAAAAIVATLARIGVTLALVGYGWWFVQEKVLFGLPLQVILALPAAVLLLRAVRSKDGLTGPVQVALFTAGYAAVASFVVTFLFGYPLRLNVVLLALALVGAAALITWRVLSPERSRSRLAVAGVAAAVGAGGIATGFVPGSSTDAGGGAPLAAEHHGAHGRSISDLVGPDPSTLPPGTPVRRYELTAKKTTATLKSGQKLETWSYNGKLPGPELTATEGDLVEVRLRNDDIDRGVTIHWHGYDVPNREDGAPGVTQDAVMPGKEFVYRFRAAQVGTYWYHTHQVSDLGVRMGLYGTLVVSPRGAKPSGVDLTVPVHTFNGTVVLGDADEVVNRTLRPGTPVRLRLVNTDSTPRRFVLAGTSYRLVSVDGRDLNEPGAVAERGLVLAAGGRYDLTFEMPERGVALYVDSNPAVGLRFQPEGGSDSFVSIDETSGWPELDLTTYGKPARTPITLGSDFDRRFTLVLDKGIAVDGWVPKYAYTIDGRAFPDVPMQEVKEGDLVLMTVVSRGLETHPWHLHGHGVLVLSKNGLETSGSPLWMDTFDVRPGQVWQVAFRATNPGVWMNHCHNLPHADKGMMIHLMYEGISGMDGH